VSDWRLQGQERFLTGVELWWRAYRPSRKDWDHDHCEFCSATFSTRPDDLHEGYTTKDNYHWICSGCYEDFKDELKWTLLES
jgi:hypothetical protein